MYVVNLCVVLLFSRQGEERVFMFPGTSCLVPIYVQNRELVKFPMTTIDNDDIALIIACNKENNNIHVIREPHFR
jgi:hypothetical protein